MHLYLQHCTRQTKVSTSSTRSTVIHWAKEGKTQEELESIENWHVSTIPEVFTTVINDNNEIETEGYKEED